MARGVDQLVKQDFVGTVRITPPDPTWRKKYVRARASTLGDGANGLILQVLSANGHTPSANMHRVMRRGDSQRLKASRVRSPG
jgi:hypothetical protein